MKKTLFFTFLSVALILNGTEVGATIKEKTKFRPNSIRTNFPSVSAVQWEQMEKEANEIASREPAESKRYLSPELEDIIAHFVGGKDHNGKFLEGVKDVKKLEILINQSEDETFYNSLPLDAKFVAAQLPMLRAYRGILYRIRPYASNTDEKQGTPKVVHSLLLTAVQNLVTWTHLYLPTDQWNVISDYITEPQDDMEFIVRAAIESAKVNKDIPNLAEASRIHDSGEFQYYLHENLHPRLEKMINRLIGISQSLQKNKRFYFDNRLLYGNSSFEDGLNRYRRIGKAELWSLIAANLVAISQLDFSLAYSLTDVMKAFEALGKLQGVDVFMRTADVKGSPSRERTNAIKSEATKNLFMFDVTDGQKSLDNAFSELKLAALYGTAAEKALHKRKENEEDAISGSLFKSGQKRVFEPTYAKLKELVNGETTLRSQLTGVVIKVNLPNFFSAKNHPTDLKAFLPTEFVSGDVDLTKTIKIHGNEQKDQPYRNYRDGEAKNWNIELYQRYFPEVKSAADLKTAAEVLGQSYGGFLVLGPLSAFML